MLATHLRKILAAKTLVTPKTKKRVTLNEESVMKVQVAGVPPQFTAVDMRQIGSLSGLNNGSWMKTCDYLLVFNKSDRDYAIFVELKKTLYEDKSDGMEQLRRSLPYLKYLHSVCRLQFASNLREPIVKYIIVAERYSRRFDKQRVRPGGRLPAENYKEISVHPIVQERINFRDLWRK